VTAVIAGLVSLGLKIADHGSAARPHMSGPVNSHFASGSSLQQTPTGFPGQADTGYENAPGYPGHLTDCSRLIIQSYATYRYCNFPNGVTIGSATSHPINVTFIGCKFSSNAVVNADVATYGKGSTFLYDTFQPSTVRLDSEPASPYAKSSVYNHGYQYGIDQRYDGSLTVDHSDFWGFAEAIQFKYSNRSSPLTVKNSWIHNPRSPGRVDHTDGILNSYGRQSYIIFNHNTIIGNGNTNALALQGPGYSHVMITNNYLSGYGYMVNTGGYSFSTWITFTGNVWGTDIEPIFGPLYNDAMYMTSGLKNVWRNNTIYVSPSTAWMARGNNDLYWWPTDRNPLNKTRIVGHKKDYAGPSA
jgi:hypothetical protein